MSKKIVRDERGRIKKGSKLNPNGRPRKIAAETNKLDSKQSAYVQRIKNRQTSEVKADGWSNIFTQMGSSRDPSEATRFAPDFRVDLGQLESMYRSSGIARRVVDLTVDEALREWIEIEGDADGQVLAAINDIGTKKALNDLWKWGRLYGGAIAVAIIDDGLTLDMPLEDNRINQVLGFRVYDRWQISWESSFLYQNPSDLRYGYPEMYRVQPYGVGTPFYVHDSRIIKFEGEPLPEKERIRNQGWGDSIIQSTYDSLRAYGSSFRYTEQIIRQFEQMTVSISGLTHMIAQDEDDKLVRRFQLMDMTRSLLNSIFLDADGEAFQKHSSSVGGLAELLDRFMIKLSADTGIPVTKLFGRSAAGMNSTGENDLTQWYDDVHSQQEDHLRPMLTWILEKVCLANGWNFDDYEIKFRPLWTPSEKEVAETRRVQSETDTKYYQMGLSGEVILKSRFGGDHYSLETELTGNWFEEAPGLEDMSEDDREAFAELEGEANGES